jgi:hypothetical protein
MSDQQTASPLDCPIVSPRALPGDSPDSALAARVRTLPSLSEALRTLCSFPAMLAMVLIGRVFYEARTFFVDPDVWWHIKVGQDILRTHSWPTVDPYSFTAAGTPWIAYEWLGEALLALVWKWGGNLGLFVLLTLVTSAVILGLYYYGTLRSGSSKAAFASAFALSSLAFLSFTLRPQMFGYCFLVLLLIVLEWFRRGVSWAIWTLPPLFLFWVNTHGSFIVGIGVLVVFLCCGLKSFELGSVQAVAWTAKQRIQLELALLLSLAMLSITPYGTRLAVYPFDMMFNQPINVANVTEWRAMPFNQQFGKLFLGLLVLLVALQILFRLTWRLEEALLALGGAVAACLHARMLLLFVPFFMPVLTTMAARFAPRYQRTKDKYFLNAAVIAAVIVAIVHYFPSRQFLQKKLDTDFPVQALAYLDSHNIPGPMYNTYYFGGYLIGQGRKTFIDGRGDLFEHAGVMYDVVAMSQIKTRPLAILDHYRIVSCLLMKDEPLNVPLTASREWKRIYADSTAAIFVRTTDTPSTRERQSGAP